MNRSELLKHFRDPIKVLDHGYVRLIEVMGDDHTIEASARLSYQKGTRPTRETRGLLRYMLRHDHATPFESCVITVEMKVPIFVARQFHRHRTQSINELSARYSELPEETYIPQPERLREQSETNKQGTGEKQVRGATFYAGACQTVSEDAFRAYQEMLRAGVAREVARTVLPVSTYTVYRSTMNLRNLLHFLGLRLDPHAQEEARAYAEAIAQIVKAWVPLTWEAFEDYKLGSVTFSRAEAKIIRLLVEQAVHDDGEKDTFSVFSGSSVWKSLSKREKIAFLSNVGLSPELLEG